MFFNWLLKKRQQKKDTELGILDKKVKIWVPLALLFPSFIAIFLFTILPFLMVIEKAFTPLADIFNLNSATFGIRNFELLFTSRPFVIGLRNSFLYSIISLPVTLMIALIISSAIVFVYNKVAKGFWQTIFFLPYVTSSVAISIAFIYILDSSTGVLNAIIGKNIPWLTSGEIDGYKALFGIIIYGVWRNLAFNVLILSMAMLSVDKTLYKAASIDSASPIKQFFKITLPSIKKSINFLLTLGILGGLQVFPLAIFSNNPDAAISNGASTVLIFIFRSIRSADYGIAGAATIILFVLGTLYGLFLRNTVNLFDAIILKVKIRNVRIKAKI
ncbi:sugar ABC transporter permease [Mycoplasmoides gallisepticum]|uniref:ABC-type sn-glycerol-3-phosphate transport system permease protein ugpA n=2 Tax=Mycoplasmoides gallisepticum TaxID=2096 RepID=Q7NC46_MYCGA|nr:sugar ABC transporter permease [Mycoplasmoides gallisepticum]AAP56385.2 ABC-type sn-glycerol-3-phosphate transport system permease protein ugpA [Mycoplasmoides gallisepticum str. R(low)]ADC30217.1 ABC-type sn-glycerol-3-phosphate transport system permease protein ugpA [Mycoplasmoides gallisepticum str. R(high)]AFP75673.1 ABC-type sn-glycerol-3-phosphate transport system permease protein ugpA [Mycoplasmoides gallisepticum VA94_7994-1-7P]AFP76440.1 ABC-type sn-glycerol-3-phosphate transport sy